MVECFTLLLYFNNSAETINSKITSCFLFLMHLQHPANSNIPFIAYGSFKPNELRFNLIEEYVEDFYEISIRGLMEEKDGVPIFGLGNEGYFGFTYQAYVLNFKQEYTKQAYQRICDNEPDSFYEWGEYDNKNILIGKPSLKGKNDFLQESWTFRNDPYFEYGLKACSEIFNNDISQYLNVSEKEYFPFFKSSSAYMLLWTIIERFCTLKYGNLSPSQKLKCLTSDAQINWDEIILNIVRTDKIYRSDKINEILVLDKNKGAKKIMEYYYGIRSNMVHRGKEVFSDTFRISDSFGELKLIFEEILKCHGYYDKIAGIIKDFKN